MSEFTAVDTTLTYPRKPPLDYISHWYSFETRLQLDDLRMALKSAFTSRGIAYDDQPVGDRFFLISRGDENCWVNIFVIEGGHVVEFTRGSMSRATFADTYDMIASDFIEHQ